MMRGSRLLLAAFLLLAGNVPARAIGKNAGTSGAQFLKLGAGSRAGAMGEAYSAAADDVYSVYYNPAGLTRMTGSQLAASHTELFQNINYEFAAFAMPLGKAEGRSKHVLAAAIYSLQVSGIERRVEDTNNPIGNFNAGDYSYNLSYARWIDKSLSLGMTAKLISQRIDSYSSEAFAVDGGLQYRPGQVMKSSMTLSLVLRNFGSRPKFAGESDPLPFAVVAGAACEVLPKRLTVDIDAVKYRDTGVIFGLGGEYRHEFLQDVTAAVRTGITTHRRDNEGLTEVTAGGGITFRRATFDISWVPFGVLGNSFRYSFVLKF